MPCLGRSRVRNRTAELEDALIPVVDRKLANIREVLPLLEVVAQSGSPLLLIAEEVEGEALATTAMKEKKDRVEDAVYATRAAVARRGAVEVPDT